jgi:hypothetical protein
MWKTEFKTAENQIVHDFGNGYQIVVDVTRKIAYKARCEAIIEDFSMKGMLLETFHQILINFEKAVVTNKKNKN